MRDLHFAAAVRLGSVPIDSAPKRLRATVDRVERDRARITLTKDGRPVACLVPIEDATLLEELENRVEGAAAAQAMAAWEQAGRDTVPLAGVFARFGVRRPPKVRWEVRLAARAQQDLLGLSLDHRPVIRALARLGDYPAVQLARRLGDGTLRSFRIDPYRLLFFVDETQVTVLRVATSGVEALLP